MARPATRPSRFDVALALSLAVVCVGELFTSWAFEHTAASRPSLLHLVVAVAVPVALIWRRCWPEYVTPFVVGALALQPVFVTRPNVFGEIIVLVIALFAVTAYARSWRTAAISGGVSLVLAFGFGLSDEDPVGGAITGVILGGIVMAIGVVVRRVGMRAEEAERQRELAEERARQVATEERARIARELHDVVAHGVSVILLQARGGRRRLDAGDSVTARSAFTAIDTVAAECLDEMRHLVALMRGPAVESTALTTGESTPYVALTPQPKLSELAALIDRVRAGGTDVEVSVVGQRRELTPAVELAGYRIAQEALTNAMRHASGSPAHVVLRFADDALEIEVVDDGPGSRGATEPGHGLVGMRERVELFGGSFVCGDEPTGGFGVRARIPLPSTPA